MVAPQQLPSKDFVYIRGLPNEVQVEDIIDFLGDHAKNIVHQGIHMVFNYQVSWHSA